METIFTLCLLLLLCRENRQAIAPVRPALSDVDLFDGRLAEAFAADCP